MEKKEVIEYVKKAREQAKKRNFKQSFDLFISLKHIDLNKPEGKLDLSVTLPHLPGRAPKICALVDKELGVKAKEVCYKTIMKEDFGKYASNPKMIRKIADECDYFIAQGNIMADIATVFGKFLGSRGKMPNPKIGAIIPPNGNVKPIVDKLQKLIVIKTKNTPTLNIRIANEEMADEEVAENIIATIESVEAGLPHKHNQMKAAYIKLTMGPTVKIYG